MTSRKTSEPTSRRMSSHPPARWCCCAPLLCPWRRQRSVQTINFVSLGRHVFLDFVSVLFRWSRRGSHTSPFRDPPIDGCSELRIAIETGEQKRRNNPFTWPQRRIPMKEPCGRSDEWFCSPRIESSVLPMWGEQLSIAGQKTIMIACVN